MDGVEAVAVKAARDIGVACKSSKGEGQREGATLQGEGEGAAGAKL
jgi:hypothetical protein